MKKIDGLSPGANENPQKTKEKTNAKKSNKKGGIFLSFMILTYVVLYFYNQEKTAGAIKYSWGIIKEIAPILIIIYIFMILFSFVSEDKIKKSVETSPTYVKYILMSLLGTLSHGPIFAWYPFLKELDKKGLSKGSIATFLYSRGVKISLLPMLVSFFDLRFVVILTATTIIFSLIEGLLIDLTYR